MVTPKGDGTATITVTASVAATSAQLTANSASVDIEVTVDALPQKVTVTTEPMGSVEEGDTVTVMAKLNQEAMADTTIDLNVSGPVTGEDHSVTIMSGSMMGEAELMVMNDDVVSPMNDIVIVTSTEAEGVDVTPQVLTLSVTEDDTATTYELMASADSVMEGGDAVTITATASQASVGETTITLMRDGASTAAAGDFEVGNITIADGATTGTASLMATDDGEVEEDETLTLNAMVGDMTVGSVTVTVQSDDVAAPATTYSISAPEMATEGGEVMITATASAPVEEATTVELAHGASSTLGPDQYSGTMSITIDAGSDMGTTTLTITDDKVIEDDASLTLVGSVGGASAGTVTIMVSDNDVPTTYTWAVTDNLAPVTSLMEGDDPVTVTVTASQPSDTATMVMVMAGMDSEADASDFSVTDITIPAGDTEGVGVLTIADDHDVEGDEALALVAMVGDAMSAPVMITIEDNDVATTYSLMASATSVTEGGEVTITATASAAVEGDTMVMLARDATSTLAADQYSGEMSITIADGATTGTTTLTITEDYEVEADATLMLSGSVGAMSAGSVTITVTDNDMETTYTLAVTDNTVPVTSLTEGDGPVTVTVTASQPAREATAVEVMAGSGGQADAGDFSVTAISIAAGGTEGVGVLTITDDYDVEGTEVLSLVAMVGGASSAPVMITVMDNDVETTYSVSASASSVMEGGEVTITATANQMVRSNTEVMLMRDGSSSAGADDFSLAPPMITIMSGQMSGSVTLTATDDEDVEGNETLTLNATVGGMSAGMVMVTIEDNDVETTYSLSASADMVEEGGAAVTITATANQAVKGNTEVMVMRDASSTAGDADYSLDPSLITIMDGQTSGSAMLTATDDTDVEGEESLTLNASVDGMSAGSVKLSVVDNDVVSKFTLSGGPMDMNLVEGMEYDLTVTADPAVQVDTEVTIMRDRGASTADDADFTVGSVMISAGSATGTTKLMVIDDGVSDSGHGMPEELALYGMSNGESTNTLTFNIWDAAVPALPIIAQLLLAAFLAIGGYRRYLRR